MTNPDYTHAVLVVDRSGSMMDTQQAAQGGIDNFIEEQKNGEGRLTLTIIEFDNQIDTVCDFMPIEEVNSYHLSPRGATALFDAIGVAINSTGEKLAELPEEDRPGKVVVTIVTDGYENSSREFNSFAIKDLISHQEEKYSWAFGFLGADLSSSQGSTINIHNSTSYDSNNTGVAYAAASAALTRTRASSAPAAASYSLPEYAE